jgi:hypothetical protein
MLRYTYSELLFLNNANHNYISHTPRWGLMYPLGICTPRFRTAALNAVAVNIQEPHKKNLYTIFRSAHISEGNRTTTVVDRFCIANEGGFDSFSFLFRLQVGLSFTNSYKRTPDVFPLHVLRDEKKKCNRQIHLQQDSTCLVMLQQSATNRCKVPACWTLQHLYTLRVAARNDSSAFYEIRNFHGGAVSCCVVLAPFAPCSLVKSSQCT